MTDTRTAWADVGDQLSALCLKIKLHAEEELSDDEVRLKEGVDKLRDTVEGALDAVGDAFQDEAVRANVREVGRAFVDALDVTLRDARDRIRSDT